MRLDRLGHLFISRTEAKEFVFLFLFLLCTFRLMKVELPTLRGSHTGKRRLAKAEVIEIGKAKDAFYSVFEKQLKGMIESAMSDEEQETSKSLKKFTRAVGDR